MKILALTLMFFLIPAAARAEGFVLNCVTSRVFTPSSLELKAGVHVNLHVTKVWNGDEQGYEAELEGPQFRIPSADSQLADQFSFPWLTRENDLHVVIKEKSQNSADMTIYRKNSSLPQPKVAELSCAQRPVLF